jgi:hypothetical protein
MRSTIRALTAGALLAIATATTGSAASPTIIPIPPVDYLDPFVCDADPVIHVTYTGPFRLTLFKDAAGNVTRDAITAPGVRVVLTDEATGRSLSGASPAVFRTTYDASGSIDRLTVNGLNAAITVPGHGLVLLDTGRIVWALGFQGPVLQERGPHAWLGSGDAEAFCGWFRD